MQPGAFDFGRSAWYDSLGGIGYATSRIDRFTPIRKWAAATALVAALLYLGLSGAAVPTVRSSIMTSLVLLAVLLDHPALTMRNVALAAFAILIVAPESLFDPSFQMSFAAVIALIALYEWLARERSPISDVSLFWRTLRMGGLHFWGAAVTTIVASFAVAPFALYHFHRITHFGLLANLIATPLVTLLVMLMALLSLAAMPFGLEAWPLKARGVGVDLMVATGEWVAGLPGAVTVLPALSSDGLAMVVLGGLWLCLWRTKLRAFGLVFILLATSSPRLSRGLTSLSRPTARRWPCAEPTAR